MRRILLLFVAFFISFATANDGDLSEFESEYKQGKVFDPLSGYNRAMTSFNDKVYRYLFIPAAKGYDFIMPDPLQKAVDGVFYNAMYPVRFVNNIFQGKFGGAWDETQRFFINTTLGFAGLSDKASEKFNIPKHDEDFGQTLGYWGVGSGFAITLPFIGQSNLRDTFGLVGDYALSPLNYIDDPHWASFALVAYAKLNELSLDPDKYVNFTRDAVDLYTLMRDAYEQRRDYLIKE